MHWSRKREAIPAGKDLDVLEFIKEYRKGIWKKDKDARGTFIYCDVCPPGSVRPIYVRTDTTGWPVTRHERNKIHIAAVNRLDHPEVQSSTPPPPLGTPCRGLDMQKKRAALSHASQVGLI